MRARRAYDAQDWPSGVLLLRLAITIIIIVAIKYRPRRPPRRRRRRRRRRRVRSAPVCIRLRAIDTARPGRLYDGGHRTAAARTNERSCAHADRISARTIGRADNPLFSRVADRAQASWRASAPHFTARTYGAANMALNYNYYLLLGDYRPPATGRRSDPRAKSFAPPLIGAARR